MPLEGVFAGVPGIEAFGVDGGGMLFRADALGARAWVCDGVRCPAGVPCFVIDSPRSSLLSLSLDTLRVTR